MRSHDVACTTNLSRMSSTLNIFSPKVLTVTFVQNQERSKEPCSQNEQSGWGLFCFPQSNLSISSLVVLLAIMCIFSVILWYRNLEVCSVQFTVISVEFYLSIPSPEYSQYIKPLQYQSWLNFLMSF